MDYIEPMDLTKIQAFLEENEEVKNAFVMLLNTNSNYRKIALIAEELNIAYKETLKLILTKVKNAVDPERTENEAESLEELYTVIQIMEKLLKKEN